jgi:hypothetical protein
MEAIYYGQVQLIRQQRQQEALKTKLINGVNHKCLRDNNGLLVSSVSRSSLSSNSSNEERQPISPKNSVTVYNSIYDGPNKYKL